MPLSASPLSSAAWPMFCGDFGVVCGLSAPDRPQINSYTACVEGVKRAAYTNKCREREGEREAGFGEGAAQILSEI